MTNALTGPRPHRVRRRSRPARRPWDVEMKSWSLECGMGRLDSVATIGVQGIWDDLMRRPGFEYDRHAAGCADGWLKLGGTEQLAERAGAEDEAHESPCWVRDPNGDTKRGCSPREYDGHQYESALTDKEFTAVRQFDAYRLGEQPCEAHASQARRMAAQIRVRSVFSPHCQSAQPLRALARPGSRPPHRPA